jgi:hypothetical protein
MRIGRLVDEKGGSVLPLSTTLQKIEKLQASLHLIQDTDPQKIKKKHTIFVDTVRTAELEASSIRIPNSLSRPPGRGRGRV